MEHANKLLSGLLATVLWALFFAWPVGAESQEQPARWVLKDSNTTIHIFGSIHALPEGVKWLTSGTKAALLNSNTVYLEINPAQQDYFTMFPLMEKHGKLPKGTSLQDILGAALYSKVQSKIIPLGIPSQELLSFRPWVANFFLTRAMDSDTRYKSKYGVERVLMRLAQQNYIQVNGLEDASTGVAALASLSDEQAIEILKETLSGNFTNASGLDAIVEAWSKGDLERMLILSNQDPIWENYPDLSQKILYDRNHAWVKKIKDLMHVPGTFFIAVGAAHTTGPNNLILLLENDGMKAIRQ